VNVWEIERHFLTSLGVGLAFRSLLYFCFIFFKKENQEAGANSSKSLMYIFTAHKLLCNDKWSRTFNGKLQLTTLFI
jgi:hypothetical protein